MTSESAYLEGLTRATSAIVTAGILTLTGDGVELSFSGLPPVATADLTNTVWVRESLIDGDSTSSVGGQRATLELFTDGSMLSSTGCRNLHGKYIVRGAEILINELAAEGNARRNCRHRTIMSSACSAMGFGCWSRRAFSP